MSDDEQSETRNDSLDEERQIEVGEIGAESINLQASATEQPINETRQKEFRSPKKRPRKRKQVDEDPRIAEAFGYLQQAAAASKQQKDQCSLFADYIADKLRTFDNSLRAVAQHRISNVLFELEMNVYQQSDPYTKMQSPLPVHSNFYYHATQTPQSLNQTGTPEPAFTYRSPIYEHHSMTTSYSPHFQQTIRTSTSQSNPSTSSISLSSLAPSPQENESLLSTYFKDFSDSTNDSQGE